MGGIEVKCAGLKVKDGWRVIIVVLAFTFDLSPLTLHAQRQDFLSNSELLLMGGGMNYIGDLNNESALTLPRLAGGCGIRTRIGNRWAMRLEGSYGSVAQEKDYNKRRNLSFKSDILELSLLAEFNFAPFGPGATERRWTPYVFGGLGVFHFNPMASYEVEPGHVEWVALQPLCTEGQGSSFYPDRSPYKLTQLCLPFGVGIKCRLGKAFSFAAEYGFRKTWTDYLDDVSKTYVSEEALREVSSDPDLAIRLADRTVPTKTTTGVNAPGIKRGDDSLDDWYAYFHISLGISMEAMFGWMRSKKCRK